MKTQFFPTVCLTLLLVACLPAAADPDAVAELPLHEGGSTTTLVASSGDLAPNEWRHAAATYDGAMLRLYLDG